MEFLDHPIAMILVGILSFPVYKTLAKVFFGDNYEDLAESIKYVATADWYSLLKGKFWEDWDATMSYISSLPYVLVGSHRLQSCWQDVYCRSIEPITSHG